MKKIVTLFLVIISFAVSAQDDLMKELELSQKKETEIVTQTFKGSRLVNGQTMETRGKGELEFIFAHRFGDISTGSYNLYGLDQAFVRIGLEYGISNRLNVGIGRNSVDKTVDSYLRYKLLAQSSGANNTPVTVTAYVNAGIRLSPRQQDVTYTITPQDRMSYVYQLLIARKFSSAISLQLMPTFVHKNMVDATIENNDTFVLGAGGRMKITKSAAIIGEYYQRINVHANNPYHNVIGLGIEIETGGHVFQIVLTNTNGLTERAFLTETTGKFFNGNMNLGFNVTRNFQLKKKR
ncbi:MAG: hypothetical protein OJF59_002759 [Cytophagales bacterium]|jgi:hypothetical protein|nr:hypothetical protein [Bacteroidota bacterium]WHZ09005.1 MAG: hypothetical protein OJF59_002759 [Cytophagales bacterium]